MEGRRPVGRLLAVSVTNKTSKERGLNFIVVVSDSLRRDHLGCYGNDWIRTRRGDLTTEQFGDIVARETDPES